MPYAGAYDAADSTETDVFSIDFSARLATGETISGPVATLTVLSGVDATPASRLSGSPAINGAAVSQKITGLLAGVTYELAFTVNTSGGRVLTNYGTVACKGPSL